MIKSTKSFLRSALFISSLTFISTASASSNLEFGGIGTYLNFTGGKVTIKDIIPNSPASKAVLTAGDEILKVNSTSVQGLSKSQVVDLIKGEIGTGVSLELLRDGEVFSVTVPRAYMKIESYNSKEVLLQLVESDSEQKITQQELFHILGGEVNPTSTYWNDKLIDGNSEFKVMPNKNGRLTLVYMSQPGSETPTYSTIRDANVIQHLKEEQFPIDVQLFDVNGKFIQTQNFTNQIQVQQFIDKTKSAGQYYYKPVTNVP